MIDRREKSGFNVLRVYMLIVAGSLCIFLYRKAQFLIFSRSIAVFRQAILCSSSQINRSLLMSSRIRMVT